MSFFMVGGGERCAPDIVVSVDMQITHNRDYK